MIKKFDNITTLGNEPALKRGQTVPDGAVNLAWAKSPTMSPQQNMIVVDTASVVPENIEDPNARIYYANTLGILEDGNGNSIVADQYPAITDEFTIEGNITNVDLTADYILPYVHISRFFHVDLPALIPGNTLTDFSSPSIRVIDSSNNSYVDAQGNPRYRIKAIPAYSPWPGIPGDILPTQYAYRIWVFIDQIPTGDLYLTYNKIELTFNGNFENQDINHKEIINLQSYFQYRPEEGEVVDPANRDKKWYSTSSIALKEEILDLPVTNIDGYKVYVPQKAINDPRLFQLFRWRLGCTFTENFNVGTKVDHPINVGVVITNADSISFSAQVFNVISQPAINLTEAVFINPLAGSTAVKTDDAYWYVNFDTVTNDQLALFDMLVWTPNGATFDFTEYMGKINYFTQTLNKVLLIDTNSFMVPTGLGITTTAGITPQTGVPATLTPTGNNPIPTNSTASPDSADSLASVWMPGIFLGILSDLGNYNPVPPANSGWLASTVPASGTYASYKATDGNTYWTYSSVQAEVSVDSINNTTNYTYREGVLQAVNITTWYPPVFSGLSKGGNDVPPSGSGWTEGTPSGGEYLAYVATDNNMYWHPLPIGPASALTGPLAVLSGGNLDALINEIRNVLPTAYPNFYSQGGVNFGTNVDPTLATQPASTTPSTASGTLYNFPLASTNLSSQTPTGSNTVAVNSDNGVTFEDSSNIFNAAPLNGWTISNTIPVSYFQTAFGTSGAKVQYIIDKPANSNTLISGQILTMSNSCNVGSQEGLVEGDSVTTTYVNGVQYTTVTSTTSVDNVGQPASLLTYGSDVSGPNPGTVSLNTPTVPSGAQITSVNITSSTQYTDALNGQGVVIQGAPISSSNGGYSTSSSADGTLTQNYTWTNGGNGENIPPNNNYQIAYTDTTAGIGQVNATVSVTYATPAAFSWPVFTGPICVPVPVLSPVPAVIENQGLIFSTFGIPQSVSFLIPGAQQLLFNLVMLATAKRSLFDYKDNSYASSFAYSTPWVSDWVINATDNPDVLSDAEKAQYDFFFLPEDIATPIQVWQKKLSGQTCKELIDGSLNSAQLQKISDANRTYYIEVTNSQVEVPQTLGDSSLVYAWTRAYTPTLQIPPDLKTYIIRELEVTGAYPTGQYISRSYPDKPYRCQVRSYADVENIVEKTVSWVASGTATLTQDVSTYVPPSTTVVTTAGSPGVSTEVQLTASSNGSGNTYLQTDLPYVGLQVPGSVSFWQENNYYAGQGSPNFLFYGLTGRYGLGSKSDVVQWVQDALNYINDMGVFSLPNGHIPVSGTLDTATAAAIKAFQTNYNLWFKDGIIDSEFYSVLGTQILRTNRPYDTATDFHKYYNWIAPRILKKNISDGDSSTIWAKRSMSTGYPNYVWDILEVQFAQPYLIHSVTVVPYVDPGGIGTTMRIDGVSIRSNFPGSSLTSFDISSMQQLNMLGYDNQPVVIPIYPAISGDTVLVWIGQDQASYIDGSRGFGVREIYANTTIMTGVVNPTTQTVTAPGYTTTNIVSTQYTVASSGTATVSTSNDYTVQAVADYNGSGTLSNIVWQNVTVDDPTITGSVSSDGLVTLRNSDFISNTGPTGSITVGPVLPSPPANLDSLFVQTTPLSGNYYSMDLQRTINPIPEIGLVSKDDGVKLLCDISGNPIGFPAIPSANTATNINVSVSLVSYGTDSNVEIGFYDLNRNEFITNANGQPEMSYLDYQSRGANNIYIGVYTADEVDTRTSLPPTDDAPLLPFRVVMPAYGLQNSAGAKISLEILPDNLGQDDIWPIAVKPGKFQRTLTIPTQDTGAITTILSSYQGSTITAYYALPEANQQSWSALYGAPNVDVIDETPIIISSNSIQVRQTPILLVQQPTIYNSSADPVRPIFTVSTRPSIAYPWSDMLWSQIADYNVETGEIFFTEPLLSTDPNLIKINYTTVQNVYYFKEYDGTLLNLNPYSGQNSQFLNAPLYVYIVPQYMKDGNGNIIPGSQQTRTLRFATNSNVFNVNDPEYDPTAVQLGIIYVTTNLNIENLVLLDSRRRGGGADDAVSNDTLLNLVSEAENYWDVNYGTGMSYQKGGFIIVRFPTELHNLVTDQQIADAIERNITAGVKYRIEDLSGNDW